MQNMNRFPEQYVYSVAPVQYHQGLMFDGNYTVLPNSNSPNSNHCIDTEYLNGQ